MTDEVRREKLAAPKVERRWYVLRILAVLLQIAGVLVLIVATVDAALGVTAYPGAGREMSGLAVRNIVIGAVALILLAALGQLIQVQIAREENERITHKYLAALLKRQ